MSNRKIEKTARPVVQGKAQQAQVSRQALLASARVLFENKGFAATSTEEVLASTGLTRGALYHHFRDKQALFAAVLEQVHGELLAGIEAAIAGVDDPVEVLRAGCHAWLRAAADPRCARLLVVEAPAVLGPQAWNAVDDPRGAASLREGVQQALGAAGYKKTQLDAITVALNGAMNELARWLAAHPKQLPKALQVLDRMIVGFLPATG